MTRQDASVDVDLERCARARPERIAVIAHTGKTLGGGLDELRRLLAGDRVDELRWAEVPKSRKAPGKVRGLLRDEPDLLVAWGGDGMVQRCVDTLVTEKSEVPLAIVPAGTANLFATNLGIPCDLPQAVRIALHGARRPVDVGRFNGEHFAVMAGAGFDADMIDETSGALKTRLGRLAYLWTGARALATPPVSTVIKLDGTPWFEGDASCVLIGNVAKVFGPVEVFEGATPDDGWLDVGVATAQGAAQWARTLARIGTGPADRSPFVRTARARRVSIRLDRPVRYELDGGSRGKTKRIKARVVPGAVTVCLPHERH